MDPQQLLAQLRDVHSPDPIGWWPPAFGWWLSGILLIVLTALSVHAILRYRKANAWKKFASRELLVLRDRYVSAPNTENLGALITWLKRCIACKRGRVAIKALDDQNWVQVMREEDLGLSEQDLISLSVGHYRRVPPLLDETTLDQLQHWLKRVKT